MGLCTFDHFSLGVRLARLDDLVVGRVELEAVRLAAVGHLPHADVLERDDAARFLESILLNCFGRNLRIKHKEGQM
jgi:hypothetical protein